VTAEYFNEFMCLSNYGDKCLCINWQLAASLTLTLTLFLSLSHSHLPSLKIYELTALSATKTTTADKNYSININKFATLSKVQALKPKIK